MPSTSSSSTLNSSEQIIVLHGDTLVKNQTLIRSSKPHQKCKHEGTFREARITNRRYYNNNRNKRRARPTTKWKKRHVTKLKRHQHHNWSYKQVKCKLSREVSTKEGNGSLSRKSLVFGHSLRTSASKRETMQAWLQASSPLDASQTLRKTVECGEEVVPFVDISNQDAKHGDHRTEVLSFTISSSDTDDASCSDEDEEIATNSNLCGTCEARILHNGNITPRVVRIVPKAEKQSMTARWEKFSSRFPHFRNNDDPNFVWPTWISALIKCWRNLSLRTRESAVTVVKKDPQNFDEMSSNQVTHEYGESAGKQTRVKSTKDSSTDEIQRLTSLLQKKKPETRMKSIFSLKKDLNKPKSTSRQKFLASVRRRLKGIFPATLLEPNPSKSGRIGTNQVRPTRGNPASRYAATVMRLPKH